MENFGFQILDKLEAFLYCTESGLPFLSECCVNTSMFIFV